MAEAAEIVRARDLCRVVFGDRDSGRSESMRKGDVSVPGQRQRLFGADCLPGWIFQTHLLGIGIWEERFLQNDRRWTGTLHRAACADTQGDFSRLCG